ncbi:MAG: hypothetical protein SV760_09570, partial [Halobacteria archaeon]|nr:hypothetical protein [Halobacteria archaeon]
MRFSGWYLKSLSLLFPLGTVILKPCHSEDGAMGDESRERQKVRVRGIYATALTRYLSEAFDVVDPSETIRRRFEDHEFGEGDPDVLIEATDDDIGVRVTDARPTEGSSESAAEEVSRLLDELGEDAFVFEGGAQEGAVFDSVVDETLGGGAVVDIGEREAYLPYSKAESRIDEDDEVRVQVVDPAAPWDEELPVVAEGIRVSVGPATLVRGASGTDVLGGDDERSLQLERTTEMVSVEVPEGWGVRYERRAARLDVAEVESALEEAVERAESADDRIESRDRRDEEGDAGEVIAPREAFWVYLGREARFELDEERRSVETTIHGHHRVKVHHEDAGAGVDIAESVCDDPKERLPFGVLVRRFGPGEGSRVELRHGKPDGSFVSLGEGEVVSVDSDEGEVRVRREMSSEGRY